MLPTSNNFLIRPRVRRRAAHEVSGFYWVSPTAYFVRGSLSYADRMDFSVACGFTTMAINCFTHEPTSATFASH